MMFLGMMFLVKNQLAVNILFHPKQGKLSDNNLYVIININVFYLQFNNHENKSDETWSRHTQKDY